MPIIEVSLRIRRPKDEVYRVLKEIEKFPQFMRNVKDLKIIGRLPDRIITAWMIEIDGAPVNWKEEDYFDDANCKMRFNMREGDYHSYQGEWSIQDQRNSSKLTLKADFDWGIPVLGKYVSRSLEKKARRGLLGMLQAIKNEVERIPTNKHN